MFIHRLNTTSLLLLSPSLPPSLLLFPTLPSSLSLSPLPPSLPPPSIHPTVPGHSSVFGLLVQSHEDSHEQLLLFAVTDGLQQPTVINDLAKLLAQHNCSTMPVIRYLPLCFCLFLCVFLYSLFPFSFSYFTSFL